MRTVYTLGQTVCLILTFHLLSACTTTQQHIRDADAFASAGIAYADAIPSVLNESFELAITQNSHQLLIARDILTEEERATKLQQFDDVLNERRALLDKLKSHANLLRSYFVALKALASSDNATDINSEANSLIQNLAILGPSIENAQIGESTVSDMVDDVVEFTVGAFQNRVLKKELEKRSMTIERELALQEAAISLLVEDMIDNAQQNLLIEETNQIKIDYATAVKIGEDWNSRRVAQFTRTAELESYAAIKKAASDLHTTWSTFVQQQNADVSITLLIQNIQDLVEVTKGFSSED